MIRFPLIRAEVPAANAWLESVAAAHAAGRFSNFGPLCLQLERQLATRWGTAATTCVAASSGTAAIAAPLIAAGIDGPVLIPAFTFPATLAAVRMAQAQPIVMDVDADRWVVAPDALDDAFARTGARAAVLVSPFGLRCDFSAHAVIAGRHRALLVIDNAAGLGVERIGLEASPHVFEAYSMHATKPFAVGEGGVVFSHREWESSLRRALNFGLPDWNTPPGWGINGKMSELHAAVGLAMAAVFDERIHRRRRLASRYIEVASRFPLRRFCRLTTDCAWQFFPMEFPHATASQRFGDACAALGMETRAYYRPSLSSLAGTERLGPCPISERLATTMCCAPLYAAYDESELTALPEILHAALSQALVDM